MRRSRRRCIRIGTPLADKIRTIAQKIYRAADIAVPDAVARRLKGFEKAGFGHVPVCIAKTQYSFTSDPTVMGAPEGFTLPVREVRLSAGAGFVVAICGEIMTMPGLPRTPAAEAIHLRDDGEIEGLFSTARMRGNLDVARDCFAALATQGLHDPAASQLLHFVGADTT